MLPSPPPAVILLSLKAQLRLSSGNQKPKIVETIAQAEGISDEAARSAWRSLVIFIEYRLLHSQVMMSPNRYTSVNLTNVCR